MVHPGYTHTPLHTPLHTHTHTLRPTFNFWTCFGSMSENKLGCWTVCIQWWAFSLLRGKGSNSNHDRYEGGEISSVPVPYPKTSRYRNPCPIQLSKLTLGCQQKDDTARRRTGHPPKYAKAKKMKSLTLHSLSPSSNNKPDSLRTTLSDIHLNYMSWCLHWHYKSLHCNIISVIIIPQQELKN